MLESAPTFKFNELFRPDLHRTQFNACVGNNGGPYGLFDYAYGYFEATRLLLKAIDGPTLIDLLVYPICLNFRHGVELFIKYLISDLVKLTQSDANFQTNHSLEANWNSARTLIALAKLDVSQNEIDLITKVVANIMEVDPNGTIFRYPESIKGDQHLKDWSIINVAVINDVFLSLFKIIRDWHFKIDNRIEETLEQEDALE